MKTTPTVKTAAAAAPATTPQAATPAPARYLNLALIADYPDGKYRELDPAHAASIAASIKATGKLNSPLTVWNGGTEAPTMELGGKTYPSTFLEAGLHRRAALRAIRKESQELYDKLFPHGVPVVVMDGSVKDFMLRQLSENLGRKNPSLEEVYPQVMSLITDHKMKKQDIAAAIGVSPSYISQVVSIRETLGEEAEQKLLSGNVKARHALQAVKAVKAAIKEGKKPDIKAAVAKAVQTSTTEKDAGRERAPRQIGAPALLKAYKVLPSLTQGSRVLILEGVLAYLAKEKTSLPREIRAALNNPPAAAAAKK